MTASQIISFLGGDWKRMNEIMRELLHSEVDVVEQVNSSILDVPGKKLRPMVCLLVARMCGGDAPLPEQSCRFAAVSEIYHNASLMHDDVADLSDERRGQPSLSARIGRVPAVLTGDFWLSRSVRELLRIGNDRVTGFFSDTICNLAEGEMLQQQKAMDGSTSHADYLKIIYCKTASLFETAALAGAVSVGASEEQIRAAGEFARALGMAFQIKDDIMDYQGGEASGKPMGLDISECKITLPLLCAFNLCPEREAQIRESLSSQDWSDADCGSIRDFVTGSGAIAAAASELQRYVDEAISALERFVDSQAKEYLAHIAHYNEYRTI